MTIPATATEFELVDALQPIRGMALATSLTHFYTRGIYDELAEARAGLSVDALASKLRFDTARLEALMKYLRNEGFLRGDADGFSASEKAHRWASYRAWYEMMVGGYAETFIAMGDALKAGSSPASRNAALVGVGSCGISRYDSIPIVRRLLDTLPKPPAHVVDLGCGSAVYLTEICSWYEGVTAVGIEPDEGGCEAARKHVESRSMARRIEIVCADSIKYIQTSRKLADLYLLCFVIHEVLGQNGEQAVIDLIGRAMSGNADQRLLIIDIDYLIDDPRTMRHSLALAHYNPYFLLHPFTSQKLERQAYWDRLFERCGLAIERKMFTDPQIDSTNICLGWLLRRA